MRISLVLVALAALSVATIPAAHAKKGGLPGGGNGHGPAWKNAPTTLPAVAPPIAPSHGHGWKGGMPALAPPIANHGSIRSQEQHQLNAFHPTGQNRSRAEHLLDGAKGFFGKHGGSGGGLFHGGGGWGHGRGH